jgi:hypothetical protein
MNVAIMRPSQASERKAAAKLVTGTFRGKIPFYVWALAMRKPDMQDKNS